MENKSRLIYLDNLRALMIVLMVAGHAIHPYKLDGGQLTDFPDPTNAIFYNVLSEIGMTFRMPMLFFIAGFFIMHALHRKTIRQTIQERIFRLGVPFLLGLVTVCSLASIIKDSLSIHPTIYSLRDVLPALWERFIKGELALHLWFLTLLLFLNIATAYSFKYRQYFMILNRYIIQNIPMLSMLILLSCFVYTSVLHHHYGKFHFFTLPPFFRLFAMPMLCYILSYFIGILAYTNRGLEFLPVKFDKRWLLLPIAIYFMHEGVWTYNYYVHPEHFWPGSILYGLSQSISNWGMIAFLLVFAKTRMNNELPILSDIREHSFAIFWVHYPIVQFMHATLMHFHFNHILKFSLVIITSLVGSYLLSRFLLQYIPILGDALYGKRQLMSSPISDVPAENGVNMPAT